MINIKNFLKKKPSPAYRFRWYLYVLVFVMTFLGVYIIHLDIQVREQFEGKKWALPARVYARPLELYAGLRLTPEALTEELKILGYRKEREPYDTGQYWENGTIFLITTRPFKFWDAPEPSRTVRVKFVGDLVESIVEVKPYRQLVLLRLEPKLIGKIDPSHHEDRILMRLEDMPQHLINALVAVEDRQFFEHWGISIRGLTRAIYQNLKAGKRVQGGSTLTQQLVKNFYLTSERSFKRKINEAFMALLLEWHYTKEEILETYLNEVYLGQAGKRAIHGMGLAARFYFNRPLQEIDLAQSALLVNLVRGASYYNPQKHPERAKARRNLVLDVMAQQGKITPEQAERAKEAELTVTNEKSESRFPYPAFLELVRQQLHQDYNEKDLSEEGLQIVTTLNPFIQKAAEKAMSEGLVNLEKRRRNARKLQGAMIVTSTQSGEILAMVNGKKTNYAGFNRPLKARRQIGSLIKPAVYLTALEQSRTYNLITQLDDSPYQYESQWGGKIWEPKNYDGKDHGQVYLFRALANSYNVALVRLGMNLGLERIYDTLENLGIEPKHLGAKDKFKHYPSRLLGTLELTPFEVTQMYQTIASGGFRVPMRAIRDVLNPRDGKALQRYALSVEQRFDAGPIFLINYTLQKAVREGTGRHVARKLPKELILAGKTGTTNDLKDSWFAGFSTDLLTVTWVGRDDNKPMGLTGGSGAMAIWGDFINTVRPRSLPPVFPDSVEWRFVETGENQVERIPFIVAQ